MHISNQAAVKQTVLSTHPLIFGQKTNSTLPTDCFQSNRAKTVPHFGYKEKETDPIASIKKHLQGLYGKRITPTQTTEYATLLSLLAKQKEEKPAVWLKPPMSNIFVNWPANGFLEPAGQTNVPPGWVYYDTQFLKSFMLSRQRLDIRGTGSPVLESVTPLSPQKIEYHYKDKDYPEQQELKRTETLSNEGKILTEAFSFKNTGAQPWELYLTFKPSFHDLLQVRSPDTPKTPYPWIKKHITENNVENTIRYEYFNQPGLNEANPTHFASLTIYLPHPNGDGIIDPRHEILDLKPEQTSFIRLHIPPDGKTHHWELQMYADLLLVQNNRAQSLSGEISQPGPQTFKLPDIRVTGEMTHGGNIFKTAGNDLPALTLNIPSKDGERNFYPPGAGIPNYTTLFGRDSIITSLFLLPFQPEYAKQTLLVLAEYQGTAFNTETREEPGKIMHEKRFGPATGLGLTPHSPYYGSLDATPLFVILYKRYLERTGDKDFGEKLLPNALRAMDCIERNRNDHGYLIQPYQEQNAEGTTGLKNIGWRDNTDAMRLVLDTKANKFIEPEYPLAPAEVQAYLYEAYQAMLSLPHQLTGKIQPAKLSYWREQAGKLKMNFNRDFWMPAKQWPAIALDAHNKPVRCVSSAGAQAMIAGDLLSPEHIQLMAKRIMQADLMSGWGIRTLASSETAFNPVAYHNGTVWTHDNGMVALAARAQHKPKIAKKIADQLFKAAKYFPANRLPELFIGLQKTGRQKPLQYPRSCVPQAWASATPYALLTSTLGISIRNGRLSFEDPVLPTGVNSIEIRQWPISPSQSVDVKIERPWYKLGKPKISTRKDSNAPWIKGVLKNPANT